MNNFDLSAELILLDLPFRSSTSIHLRLRDAPTLAAPPAVHPDSASAGQLLPAASLPGLHPQVNLSGNPPHLVLSGVGSGGGGDLKNRFLFLKIRVAKCNIPCRGANVARWRNPRHIRELLAGPASLHLITSHPQPCTSKAAAPL